MKIQIIGTSASGKSTLMWQFRNFLRDNGFQVETVDSDETFCPDINDLRFESLDRSIPIVIETIQIKKDVKN